MKPLDKNARKFIAGQFIFSLFGEQRGQERMQC